MKHQNQKSSQNIRLTKVSHFLSISLFLTAMLFAAVISLSAQTGIRLDQSFSGKGFKRIGFGGSESNFKGVGVQPTGKIIAAGTAATPLYQDDIKDYDFLIARYNADGSPDTTFGDGGKILDDLGGHYDEAEALAVQPDGKFIIVGASAAGFLSTRLVVAKYNADGSPDLSFGEGGRFFLNPQTGSNKAVGVTTQPDGKIVVAGSSDDFFVIRINTDGSLDTNFGNSGVVITPVGGDADLITDLAIQTDGKIVAVGTSIYTYGRNDFAVVRYNSDGSLDTSFGDTGKVLTDFAYNDDGIQSVSLQADGKIVAAGYSQVYQGFGFALVRYNVDGSLDQTFNGTGKVLNQPVVSDSLSDSIIQNDGKIVVFGNTDTNSDYPFALMRYNTNGSLDTSFGQSGKAVISFAPTSSYARTFALQPDGKFVAVGLGNGNPFSSTLARINADGSLDTSFSQTGKINNPLGNAAAYLNAMKMQPDGKIVAAGFSYYEWTYHFALSRFNPDGSLDPTFNGTGTLLTKFGNSYSQAYTVALQPDGKIIAAGGTEGGFAIVRYNADGSLDTSFNGTGKVVVSLGINSGWGNSVAVQPDGKIVVAGTSYLTSQGIFALVRLNADGSLDTALNGTGKVFTEIGAYSGIKEIKLQTDGKILATGFFDGGGVTVRYNLNGSLDTSFNQTGIVTNPRVLLFDRALIQTDGKIISVGRNLGTNNRGFVLSKYNADGSPDTAFGSDGMVITQIEGSYFEKTSAMLDADGRIIVGGSIYGNTESDYVLARYNSNGNLDSTFFAAESNEKEDSALPKGVIRLGLGTYSEILNTLEMDEQGRYLLGGRINGLFGLTRLLPDGQSAATAAISGSVTGFSGSGLSHITLSLRNVQTGATLTAMTNSFGKFNFDGLTIGNLYVVTVHGGRRYQFDQTEQTVQLLGNISNLDFIENGAARKR